MFSLAYAQDDINGQFQRPPDDEDFEETVRTFEPADVSEGPAYIVNDRSVNSTGEVLQEVSELLETLSSYQRLRSVEPSKTIGNTTLPTSAEQDTYNLLKTQLEILVSLLPPFAIAKAQWHSTRRTKYQHHNASRCPRLSRHRRARRSHLAAPQRK